MGDNCDHFHLISRNVLLAKTKGIVRVQGIERVNRASLNAQMVDAFRITGLAMAEMTAQMMRKIV